jgi:hypothetical protein
VGGRGAEVRGLTARPAASAAIIESDCSSREAAGWCRLEAVVTDIQLGTGIVALVINATLGAIVLLIILRLISGLAAENGAGAGGVGNSSKARTAEGRMLKHWTSAGAANRPQVRSGYSRSGLGMTAICVFRPKTGGRRDWLYPLPTRADSSVGLRAPRGDTSRSLSKVATKMRPAK